MVLRLNHATVGVLITFEFWFVEQYTVQAVFYMHMLITICCICNIKCAALMNNIVFLFGSVIYSHIYKIVTRLNKMKVSHNSFSLATYLFNLGLNNRLTFDAHSINCIDLVWSQLSTHKQTKNKTYFHMLASHSIQITHTHLGVSMQLHSAAAACCFCSTLWPQPMGLRFQSCYSQGSHDRYFCFFFTICWRVSVFIFHPGFPFASV